MTSVTTRAHFPRESPRVGRVLGYPQVQGRCPACGWASLFLGEGGYVTCGNLHCADPCAATDQLLREARGERGVDVGPQQLAELVGLVLRTYANERGEITPRRTADSLGREVADVIIRAGWSPPSKADA